MRRRRIAFMLRAMVMTTPSFITTCGDQARTPEAAQPTPPAVQRPQAAHSAGQPIGGTMVKAGQNPKGRIDARASTQGGGTRIHGTRTSQKRTASTRLDGAK